MSREALAYKAGLSYKTIERLELERGVTPLRSTVKVIELALAAEEESVA